MQLEDYGLVQFLPLDITNEDSVGELLLFIDSAIQFGEDEDVKVPKVLKWRRIASSESIKKLLAPPSQILMGGNWGMRMRNV